MAGPNDAELQSAKERFSDIYNQPAANKNDGYFKTPNRTYVPPPPPPPPKPQKIRETAFTREQRYSQGFTSGRALNDNPGFRNPIAANQGNFPGAGGQATGNLPSRAPITRTGTALDIGIGLTQIVAPGLIQQGPNYLNPSNPKGILAPSPEYLKLKEVLEDQASLPPGFSRGPNGKPVPNPLSPDFWNPLNPISPFNERSPFHPFDVFGKDDMWKGHRPGDDYYPDPSDPEDPNLKKMGPPSPTSVRAPNAIGNAPQNSNLPPWLDPFKDTSKTGESIRENSGKPNAESKKSFLNATRIKIWSPNGNVYLTLSVLGYQITALPIRGTGAGATARITSHTYLRAGIDAYKFSVTSIRRVFNEYVVEKSDFNCEPWTLENLGPDPSGFPNPEAPENFVPETGLPFYPPHVPDFHGYDEASPPTILDRNDFRPPPTKLPIAPMFPPELGPIPKPLDPIQKPEKPLTPGTQPTKPREDEPLTKVPPLFPFDPLQSPAPPNPLQNPPTFEPGPPNPNQRLNDRGIFPAQKAPITSTVSGSPLSPDKEIGGDPVRLVPPPKITKPKPPFETEEEKKKKEEEERKNSLAPLAPLSLIPPLLFPRPTDPKGTIDPQTADDITKSKEPPKPPVGTKPKCQDKCMAGLESGQQDILSKLGQVGNAGLNVADLALLNTINNKVGDQVPGGLSGKLTRLSSWLHLDRALNLMIYANTLHNAYMLSSGLTQTLFSMISNVLAAVGIKDAENNPLDISSVLGKAADAYAKTVLGVTAVDGIKAEWKKYSRIYAAAANVLWSIQSIGQSILGVLEIVGSNVAKIGNALTKFGAIGEKAFGKMNDTPHFQNRFFTSLETIEQTTSQIDSIASEVLSAQDTFTQIGTQKAELEKAMKQEEGSKQGKASPEAATVKAEETAKKTTSQPPTIPTTAEKKPEA